MTKHSRVGIAVLTTLLAWLGIAQPAQAARLPVTSTTALSKIQQEVPGLLTSLRKVKRDGFYAWAVTIKRSDGSVVVGYVDRKSGIVFDWTVQTAPDEPVLDLDGPDRSRRAATPPPAVGEALPSTAVVDTHPQPAPVVAAVAAVESAPVEASSGAPAAQSPAAAEGSRHDDSDDDSDDPTHDDDGDHRDHASASTPAPFGTASASAASTDRHDDDDSGDSDDHADDVDERSPESHANRNHGDHHDEDND